MASDKVDFYISHVHLKAKRSVAVVLEPVPASAYLASTHDVLERGVDEEIAVFNRNFPRGSEWQDDLISLSGQYEGHLQSHRSRCNLEGFDNSQRKPFYRYDRCRSTDLHGIRMFDDLREPIVRIRPLDEFLLAFDKFTDSLLTGLDWRNVGAAGGSMLACLTEPEFGPLLANSDVDLFIWGLSPTEAHDKLEDIIRIIRANAVNSASSYLLERTAGAVTFIPRSSERGRKIQIVLRIYANPAAVLASFDIDPATIFFDGAQVWLSLRAVRAFRTGFTTTTGSISSSFGARIVKYATRGYGLLVQPEHTDPDQDGVLKDLELVSERLQTEVADRFLRLPWSGMLNFQKVFFAVKEQTRNNWTHSFSALSYLAALWNLAYKTGRIGDLMAEIGLCAASHIYGTYEG
ncbi:hypothetical protein A4X13_0g9248, partial [Tilletia indica]